MNLFKKQNLPLIFGLLSLLLSFTSNAQDVLTNQSIIALCEAKVAKAVILQKINSSKTNFDVSTEGLIRLKSAKVPDVIVKSMMVGGTAPEKETPAAKPAKKK